MRDVKRIYHYWFCLVKAIYLKDKRIADVWHKRPFKFFNQSVCAFLLSENQNRDFEAIPENASSFHNIQIQ